MIDLLGAVESAFGQINGLTITATLLVLAITLAYWTTVRPRRFPPGPRGLPFIGSMLAMDDNPEVVFGKMAKKYGDIFSLKVGERWMVVLNGPEAIKDALVKQSVDFAGRPEFYSMNIFTDEFKDIAFSPYSDTWKLHRKLAHTALRHFATGEPLQELVSSVYPKARKAIAEHGEKPVNPKVLLNLILNNVMSKMCFGKSYDLKDPNILEFMKVSDEANEGLGLGLAADFFSWAKYIPTGGAKMLKNVMDRWKNIVHNEIKDHAGVSDGNVDDFYSLLLKAQQDAKNEGENVDKLTYTHIHQTLMDIFSAGISTSAETLYWAFALLAEHPDIQAKVQKELDDVVGRDRILTINDRGKLGYTEATLYEVMRYSTIAPLLLPHGTMRDVEFHGFLIPKDTIVMMNILSVHYDPTQWEEPTSFRPEHFLDTTGTVRQHPPGFLPFGAGRRSCLGEAVAKADLFLIFTWFLQNYSFSKAPGKEDENLIKMIPKTAAGRVLLPYELVIKERN